MCTEDADPVASLENYSLFSVSQFQYIILVIVFSKGSPYRESILRNYPLMVDILLLTAFCLFLTLAPEAWPSCSQYFMLFPPPDSLGYRLVIVGSKCTMLDAQCTIQVGVAAGNLVLALFTELYLSDVLVRRAVTRRDKAYEVGGIT